MAVVGPAETIAQADTGDAYTGVVHLTLSDDTFVAQCTGTLVSCREVLTAQHCLLPTTQQIAVRLLSYSPTKSFTTINISSQLGVTVVQKQPGVYGLPAHGANDMLVVRLPGPVPKGFSPIRRHPGFSTKFTEKTTTIVGYGRTGPSCLPDPSNRRVGTQLSANTIYDGHTIDWGLGDVSSESSADEGDSGGPLLVGPASSPRLAGVFSLYYSDVTAPNCNPVANQWASVDSATNKAWLDSVLAPPTADSDADGVPDECDECALGNDYERCGPGTAAPGVPKACAPPCGCEPDTDKDGIDPVCDDQTAIQDDRLTDVLTADLELRAHPNHRIRVDRGTTQLLRGASTPLDYVNAHAFDTKQQHDMRWAYQEDYSFWQTKQGTLFELIALPPPNPSRRQRGQRLERQGLAARFHAHRRYAPGRNGRPRQGARQHPLRHCARALPARGCRRPAHLARLRGRQSDCVASRSRPDDAQLAALPG